MKELKLNQQKMAAENSALNKEVERLRYLEQLRSVPAPAPASAAAPVVKPLLPPGSTGQQRVCFSCGNPGHFARYCPQSSARGDAVIHSRGGNEKNRNRTYGPLESTYLNHEAYLRVAIGNRVYDCLLDTGSEVSLFPASIVGSANMERTNRTLMAADGSGIPTLGEVSLQVEIGSYSTQVVGLVTEHIPEPMLGIDFLTRNKVIWDFNKGLIWIANKSYLLHHRSDRYKRCGREGIPSTSDSAIPDKLQSCATVKSCLKHQSARNRMVKSVFTRNESHVVASDAGSSDDVNAEFWSFERLRTAQKDDPDISYILNLMESSSEKPCWDAVSNQSEDVRVLWGVWPRLRVWNGVLQRSFESLDGSSTTWQVILPVKLREQFLSDIHGRMNGGCLSRKRTAAFIQLKAYWPCWLSDLNAFLKECQPCSRNHRKSAHRKAYFHTLRESGRMTPRKLFR